MATTKPAAPPADVELPPARVSARFVDVQAVYSPAFGLIRYGDEFPVTVEQLAEDPRLIPWADDWTPDPALVAAASLEG